MVNTLTNKLYQMNFKITLLVSLFSVFAFSQKINEKDILGKWKLQIDIKKQIDKESKEMGLFEKIVIKSMSNMIESIIEEIDITFDFYKKGKLTLIVDVLDGRTPKEIETLNWYLDSNSNIIIDDIKSEKVTINNDGYWKMVNDEMHFYEDDSEIEKVRLVRFIN